jgi:CheY-like chemotaxis protein
MRDFKKPIIIFYVDDKKSNLKTMNNLLINMNAEKKRVLSLLGEYTKLKSFESPTQLIGYTGEESPHLIILDFDMKPINGLECLEKVKHKYEFQHSKKIIISAVSGNVFLEQLRIAQKNKDIFYYIKRIDGTYVAIDQLINDAMVEWDKDEATRQGKPGSQPIQITRKR